MQDLNSTWPLQGQVLVSDAFSVWVQPFLNPFGWWRGGGERHKKGQKVTKAEKAEPALLQDSQTSDQGILSGDQTCSLKAALPASDILVTISPQLWQVLERSWIAALNPPPCRWCFKFKLFDLRSWCLTSSLILLNSICAIKYCFGALQREGFHYPYRIWRHHPNYFQLQSWNIY